MESAIRETYVSVYAPVVHDDRALLAYNKQGPYQGKWGLPGGGVEFGETPDGAIRREIWEEIGVEVAEAVLYEVHSHRTLFERSVGVWVDFHHIALLNRVRPVSSPPDHIRSPDKKESLSWHPLRDLAALALSPSARYCLLSPEGSLQTEIDQKKVEASEPR